MSDVAAGAAAAAERSAGLRAARSALVGELIAVQRGLLRLYDAFAPESPDDELGRLIEFRQDAQQRAEVVFRLIGDGPAELPVARHQRRLVEEELVLDREQPVLRRFHRLRALLLGEEREWLLWQALDALAHEVPDAVEGLLPAVEAISTNEAIGAAGAESRHRDRVGWLRRALEQALLGDLGISPRRGLRLWPRH